MALYKLLCEVTVMILLTANGCHAIMPECGLVRERQNLDEHLPWEVLLRPANCFGTLISPSFVVTDGSCRADGASTVVLGRVNPTTGFSDEEKMAANVTCNPTSMGGLCLLKLDSPVNFTDTIYPICVASSDSIFQSGMDGYVATGNFDVTRESVPIVGDTECDRFLPERPMRTICAGRTEKQNMSLGCRAIGAVLMAKSEDHWSMIGVLNPDPDCTDIRNLRSYTAVASFADWIAEVTNMSQPGFVTFKPSGPDDFNSSTSSPSEPPQTPTSSHPNTSRPPHPPTCIHPKPPRRPTPDPSLCLYPGSDDCRDDFDSVFGNGVAIHSSPFILLCVLVLSFFGMNW